MRKRREGFREARARLIRALETDDYGFEFGEARIGRNLLQSGEVTEAFVIALLNVCSGHDHSTSPHHFNASILCHVFKPVARRVRWYIKCYFSDSGTVVISVHLAEH